MVRSRSLSSSDDDEEKNSSSGSGSESEGSSSSSGSASTSSSGTSLSGSSRLRVSPEKGGCDALAIERMERNQRVRRLLSQRNVGDTIAVDDGKYVEPFTGRKGVLDADDCVLLSTFSNSLLFSRLLAVLGSCDNPAPLEAFDEALSAANPIFYRNFKLSLEETATQTPRVSASTHRECAALERGGIVVRRRKRDRPTHTAVHSAELTEAVKRRRAGDEGSTTRGNTATSGLIANSLRNWEQHLKEELRAEGVSIETFRQQRQGDSYLEEKRFLEETQWADYQRELRLEEKRKEQEAKRAIRRGETNTD